MTHNVAFVNNNVSGDQFSCLVDMSCSNSNEMILTNTYTSNQVAANRKQVPFVEEPTVDTQPSGQLSAGENLVNITEELSAILSEFPTEDAQIPNQFTANGSQVNFAKEPPVIISEVPMEDALAVNADDEHTSSKLTGTGDHCQLLDVEVPTTAIPVDAPTSNQLTSEESQVECIEACTAEERSYHQCTPDEMHDHTALCPEAFTIDGIPREDIDDKAKEMKSRNFNVKRKRNSGESYETKKSKRIVPARREASYEVSCSNSCKSKGLDCHRVSPEEHIAIRKSYYDLENLQKQRSWIARHTEIKPLQPDQQLRQYA